MRKKATCPKCGSNEGLPILYGMPTDEAFKAAEDGEIALGGCTIIEGMSPDYYCSECGYSWKKMSKYGLVAIEAVSNYQNQKDKNPGLAWDSAVAEFFPKSKSYREKIGPKSTFLGLCEEGLVEGIPKGKYLKGRNQDENKAYAIKAVNLLKENPYFKSSANSLWNYVVEPDSKPHNRQMNVVIALWNYGLIKK